MPCSGTNRLAHSSFCQYEILMALPAARVEAMSMRYLIGDLTKRRNTGCPPYLGPSDKTKLSRHLSDIRIFEAASPTNRTLEGE
jgi:hypothetical protein